MSNTEALRLAAELRRHARKLAQPAGDTPAVMVQAADALESLAQPAATLEADALQRAGQITLTQAKARVRDRRASPVAHLALQQTEALNRALAVIETDRRALLYSHAYPAGSLTIPADDEAGADALAQYDEAIHAIRTALAQRPAADDRWAAGYKHGLWQAQHCAAQPAATVVERADSATGVVECGSLNVSDNAQPAASGEPVAKEVAAESWVAWPQNGPYRVAQMVDADTAESLRTALTELRDRIKAHPAYANLTEAEEIETGGDTAELSYLARVADAALGPNV